MNPNSNSNEAALLEVQGLQCFANGQVLLREVALRLEASEVVLIVGANGTGKSVLLRVLAGVHAASHGSVAMAESTRVFLASQDQVRSNSLLRVEEFLEAATGSLTPRASFTLEEFGLDGRQVVGTLSSGTLQRLVLATALAVGAEVTLFDSPCLGLDTDGIDLAERVTRTLLDQSGAVVVATSNPDFVMRFEDGALYSVRGGFCELVRESAYRTEVGWN